MLLYTLRVTLTTLTAKNAPLFAAGFNKKHQKCLPVSR